MIGPFRPLARRVLLATPVQQHFVLHRPIEKWPTFYGRAQGVKVPSQQAGALVAPTPDCESNISIILELLGSVSSVRGDVIECGVYQGATLAAEGLFLRQRGIDKMLFGCDSFEGFPTDALHVEVGLGGEPDPDKRVDGFADTSYAVVDRKVRRLGLADRIQLVPGFFSESLRQLDARQFCFAHLDCDLYDSYLTCLRFLWPRLAPGGIVLLDEYNDSRWPGCKKAVDEFLADKTETPIPIERQRYVKHYLVRG